MHPRKRHYYFLYNDLPSLYSCTRTRAHVIDVKDPLFCSVAENANAPDDSRIRAKEARRENRTFRRDACQVSLKISLMKVRTIDSTIVERVHYLLPRPIITIAFLPNLNAQANVSENNPRIIYCAFIYIFFVNMCTFYHVLCALLNYY